MYLLITGLMVVVGVSGLPQDPFAAPPPNCQTVYGRPCIFPFKYKGKTYRQCTHDTTTDGEPWCAYEVQADGTAVPGKWENCDKSQCAINEPVCRTVDGPDRGNTCKFPFRFNGRTYYSCAAWVWGGSGQGRRWCSTRTDSFGNHINGEGSYGFCDCGQQQACGCGGGGLRGVAGQGFAPAAAPGEDEPAGDAAAPL